MTAGVDGVLQKVDVEEGQRLAVGTIIAGVSRLDALKAELRIEEGQAREIAVGQSAVLQINGATVAGKVSRVSGSVQSGTLAVDVLPDEPLPAGARPDLRVDGTIRIDRLPNVLFVGKPVQLGSTATRESLRGRRQASRIESRCASARRRRPPFRSCPGCVKARRSSCRTSRRWAGSELDRNSVGSRESSGMKPLLVLEGVSKTFYTDKVQTNALSDITLQIFEGEFVTIAGPSGCGKSTLLSILGLLDSPTTGRYVINQTALEKLDHAALARIRNAEIGFVFQDFNLIGDMTVFENVELPSTHRNLSRKERHSRVMECLETVGMTARAEHYPSQLSGGQQQRVAVARSVVGKPSVLLADEPTGNLDSANGDAVMTTARGAERKAERDHLHGHARFPLRRCGKPHGAPVRRQDHRGRATARGSLKRIVR